MIQVLSRIPLRSSTSTMSPTAWSMTEMSAAYERRMPRMASSVIVSESETHRNEFNRAP